ncbi:MAG: hypothetical protein NT013_10550 [Planctomycetia bacterium]|nr:hypothetical protein [Planctomycetia bacterium]
MKKQTKTPADGPHKELFSDGTLSGEERFKDGKRHGKWKFYLRNGQLKTAGKYVAGELDGHWEWWRENGKPLQAGAFTSGSGNVTTRTANSGMKGPTKMAKRLANGSRTRRTAV